MLDLKGRSRIAPILDPIAVALSKARLTPTMVTAAGLVVTFAGSILIAAQRYTLGAIIAAVGCILDAVDGPLARHQGKASIRGAFVDTMSDRFGEIAIWSGLAFSLREEETALMLCLFALAFSLLTPYVRAKAESWGAEGRGGWMGRAERMMLILIGVFAAGIGGGSKVLYPVLWVFVVLAGLTVLQRIRKTWEQLER